MDRGFRVKLAQVENEVVVNVIVVNAEDIPEWAQNWPVVENAGPGWLCVGGVFSPPEEQEEVN